MNNAWSRPIGEFRSTIAAAHSQAFVRTDDDLTFLALINSDQLSSLSLDVTNISVWVTVTALWVMKTKIAGDQMKALGVVWSELLHLVIRDKNRNMLTPHILIDQISYKLWLWITSKNEITWIEFIECHHNRLNSLVKLFLTSWISSSYLALEASYFYE